MTAVLVVVAFVAAYVLIATERIHRVAAALCGAAAMVVLGVVDAQVAFFSEETGVDWNVIFLLLGMMVIVSVLQADRRLRVPRDLGRQTRPRPALRDDGDAGRHHRRGLGAARQRHHGAADRPGDPAGVRPAGPAAGAVPDRRGAGLQHRRHRDPGRRPAQHHHRQPGRPVLQRLPGQPRPDRRCSLLVVFIGLCRVLFRSAFRYDAERVAGADGAGRARGRSATAAC